MRKGRKINEDYVRREIEILYNNRSQQNDDLMIVEREREDDRYDELLCSIRNRNNIR